MTRKIKFSHGVNRKISGLSALFIIVVLAAALSSYSLIKSRDINFDEMPDNLNGSYKKIAKNACHVRAFQGSAEVDVWQTVENDRMVLKIDPKDAVKLPLKEAQGFQIIDPTPALQEELADSSESAPVRVKISGFADLCEGIYLASLDYKDGIFKPYILN